MGDDGGRSVAHDIQKIVHVLLQGRWRRPRGRLAVAPAVVVDDPEIGELLHDTSKALGTVHRSVNEHDLRPGVARSVGRD